MSAISIKTKKLLKRVSDFYRQSFSEDSDAMAYLRDKLLIHRNLVIDDLGLGYSNGSLVDALPDDPTLFSQLLSLGILDQQGREKLTNCLVAPLTDQKGDIINLHVHNIPKSHAWHTNRSGAGILNGRAFKAYETIMIAPTVNDVLVFYDRGHQNCVYLYCRQNLGEFDPLAGVHRLKEAVLIRFGSAQRKSCLKVLEPYLKKRKIILRTLMVPGRSAVAYFQKHSTDEFDELLRRNRRVPLKSTTDKKRKPSASYSQTPAGFLYTNDNRKYEIKGIQKKSTQLKVTIKAILETNQNAPFEISTVDMYSYRARVWFAKLCSDLFAEPEDLVQIDLHRILEYAEAFKASKKHTTIEMTNEEKQEALRFLQNPDLMNEILIDFESIGIVGERTNKLVGYLAAVSRKLSEPLSVLIQSRSAAGKSTLQDAILKLVPEEDVMKYTRITDQALFYAGEDAFCHKILAIEEGPGMERAAYSIRNIQSAGKITVASAGKSSESGGLQTREYTVKGPVSVMATTTATTLDEETASRFIVLTIDESPEMTKAIHEHHRDEEALNGILSKRNHQKLVAKHHNAQRLLKLVTIVNPYAKNLSYPTGSLKTRRDFKKYLGLIKAVSLLHQYQRKKESAASGGKEIEYIEVTPDDIERANALAAEVLCHSLDDLPASSRQLLKLIFKMVTLLADQHQVPLAKVAFTRRMIREHTGWSNWQVRSYLPPLADLEYIVHQSGSRKNRYTYAINREGSKAILERELQLTPASDLS